MVNHGALLILVSELAFLLINHFRSKFRQFSIKMLGHFEKNFRLFAILNQNFWLLFQTLFFIGFNFTGNPTEVNLKLKIKSK